MSHPEDRPTAALETQDDAPDAMSPERRAALQKLGLITAWTAPTLLMLGRLARADVGFGSTPEPP